MRANQQRGPFRWRVPKLAATLPPYEGTQLETIAYHEAGHAFMAIYVGAKVRSVTIEPDRDDGPKREGDTQIVWRRSRMTDREFREKAILVVLAGPVAEMIYTGDPFHPGTVAEWSADWAEAWSLAEFLFAVPEKRMAFLERVCVQLFHQLKRDKHWPAIAALADHLLAHETLEDEEVREIVSAWWP